MVRDTVMLISGQRRAAGFAVPTPHRYQPGLLSSCCQPGKG